MKAEQYFSVDVESAGPVPGIHSMLSLGACIVGRPNESFYVELKPISKDFDSEALKVSGFDLKKLAADGVAPEFAMTKFQKWIDQHSKDAKPVFVGFNACYDWQFVNWYFHKFTKTNPFGFGGIDIKSYFMGLRGLKWGETTSSQLPPEFQPDQLQTHNALDDARAQASMFEKMMQNAR